MPKTGTPKRRTVNPTNANTLVEFRIDILHLPVPTVGVVEHPPPRANLADIEKIYATSLKEWAGDFNWELPPFFRAVFLTAWTWQCGIAPM
jgi:hypothetical protein